VEISLYLTMDIGLESPIFLTMDIGFWAILLPCKSTLCKTFVFFTGPTLMLISHLHLVSWL
jgi:hypothetical protein